MIDRHLDEIVEYSSLPVMVPLGISPSSGTSSNGVNFVADSPPVILKVLLTIFVVFSDATLMTTVCWEPREKPICVHRA